MNHSILKKIGFIAMLLTILASSSAVLAQGLQTNTGTDNSGLQSNTGGGTFTLSNPLKANSIGEVVLDFIQIFSYVVVLIAVLCLIWVGFMYILASAQGNATKIKELHGYLLYIVIGIAVVISARVIVQVVLNTLKATGTVNTTVLDSANNALK